MQKNPGIPDRLLKRKYIPEVRTSVLPQEQVLLQMLLSVTLPNFSVTCRGGLRDPQLWLQVCRNIRRQRLETQKPMFAEYRGAGSFLSSAFFKNMSLELRSYVCPTTCYEYRCVCPPLSRVRCGEKGERVLASSHVM